MKEYIEKTAARNAVKRVIGDQDHTCKAMMDFYVALNEAPTADVVEVRHGRWSSNGIALVCSECGRAFGIVEMFAHYCPWCGSRMDKEDEHEAG